MKYPVKRYEAGRAWSCGEERGKHSGSPKDDRGPRQSSIAVSLPGLPFRVEVCHFQMEPLATLFHREVELPSLVLHLLGY